MRMTMVGRIEDRDARGPKKLEDLFGYANWSRNLLVEQERSMRECNRRSFLRHEKGWGEEGKGIQWAGWDTEGVGPNTLVQYPREKGLNAAWGQVLREMGSGEKQWHCRYGWGVLRQVARDYTRRYGAEGGARIPRFRPWWLMDSVGWDDGAGLKPRREDTTGLDYLFKRKGIGTHRVRFNRPFPPGAVVKTVRVVCRQRKTKGVCPGIWELHVSIEVPNPGKGKNGKVKVRDVVGHDLGGRRTSTNSRGATIRVAPRDAKARRRAQRAAQRCVKGSKGRRKVLARERKRSKKETRRRNEQLRQCAAAEVKNGRVPAKEDMSWAQLRKKGGGAAGRGRNRVMDAASPGKYGRMLEEEARKQGLPVAKVDPRGTSKTHQGCRGTNTKLRRSTLECFDCGVRVDRDWNAALNIRERALAALGMQDGAVPAPGDISGRSQACAAVKAAPRCPQSPESPRQDEQREGVQGKDPVPQKVGPNQKPQQLWQDGQI